MLDVPPRTSWAQEDLTLVDNDACQACHQQRYRSLAEDHPDFGIWPYERRTRIAFNHAAHRGKHFPDKKQSFDCRTCHLSDASGRVERLASYETACAPCHNEKIATSVGRGVPILALPTLDVDALKKAGHNIGPWPQGATGDFDGRLPPAMKLLLAADPAAAKAMAKLGPAFEFQDVSAADAGQLAACADLATATKTLFSDLCKRGPIAIRERMSIVLGRKVTEDEATTLAAGLSVDTMRAAANWLPATDVSAANWQMGGVQTGDALSSPGGVGMSGPPKIMPTPAAGQGMPPLCDLSFDAGGDWSSNDATFSIRYRPAAHSDPVMAAWIEVLANTPQLESRPIAAAMLKELTKATAPGLCASCHSVERTSGGRMVINWRASDRSTEPRGFTKFTHAPHVVIPQLADCTSCHRIDDAAIPATAYTDFDPRRFASDFQPLAKRLCAECHTNTAAGDACQSCHNYHVETVEAWRLKSPADAPKERMAGRLRNPDFESPIPLSDRPSIQNR